MNNRFKFRYIYKAAFLSTYPYDPDAFMPSNHARQEDLKLFTSRFETFKNQKVFQSKAESVLLRTHPDVRKYTQDFFYPLYSVCITQMPVRCLGLVMIVVVVNKILLFLISGF